MPPSGPLGVKLFDNWVLIISCHSCHTVMFGAWKNGIQPQILQNISNNSKIMYLQKLNNKLGLSSAKLRS